MQEEEKLQTKSIVSRIGLHSIKEFESTRSRCALVKLRYGFYFIHVRHAHPVSHPIFQNDRVLIVFRKKTLFKTFNK